MKRTRAGNHRTLLKQRRRLGMTQSELHNKSGVSLNRIVFAETGRVTLDDAEVDRIRDVFRRKFQKTKVAMDAIGVGA